MTWWRPLACFVAASVVVVSCSSEPERTDPPPVTRATIAPPVTTTDGADAGGTTTAAPSAGADPASSADPAAGGDPLEYTIDFEPLPEFGDRVEGGWITVPVDYSDPGGATIRLWVTRHLADEDDRVGALFTNNGGPGVAASSMATRADDWFESPLVDRFDIVSWDPRGTGVSDGAVDCIDAE